MDTALLAHQQLQAGAADLWQVTPATLASRVSRGTWLPASHLLYISHIVAAAIYKGFTTGVGDRIIVNVPPRHGKSRLLSIWTPIWVLKHWPAANIILASYGADLSADFSREARDTIIANEDMLGIRLKKDTRQVLRWMTEEGGGMFAVGVGGPITGRGANVLLIDDYIKNAAEAASQSARDTAYNWFQSTAFTRLEPGAPVIIVVTRWHPDDVVGRLIEERGSEWKVINLPALATREDVLDRTPGQALWPSRYNEQALAGIREAVGPFYWKSLYQQDPIESRSGMFDGEKLQIVDIPPNHEEMLCVRAWDLAATQTSDVATDPDYTTGLKLAYDKSSGFYYILDIKRERKSPAGVETMLRETAEGSSDVPGDGVETYIRVEQEPGSAGKNNIALLHKYVLSDYNMKGVRATGPKTVRANPFLAGIESGLVRAVRAPWNRDFKREMSAFPDGAHEDQIDAGALAYSELRLLKRFKPTWGRTRPGQVKVSKGPSKASSGATFGRR